jgi:hypothetical protein
MFSPRRVIAPERTFTRPNIALSNVDLPAPLGPDDPDQLTLVDVQVAVVEDVDAGQVAGDEVVGTQQGAFGGGLVTTAVGRRRRHAPPRRG